MLPCTSCGHQFEPRDSTARPGDVIGCPACGSPLMMPDAQTLAYQEGTPIAVMSPVEQRPNAMSDQEVLPAGSMLGPYRIERFIGRGGMGSVYLATHTMLTRQVALKVLPLRFAKDAEFVERFRREALALASLSHPNIVAVHDMGTQGEISWLAMEFVEGPNLRDLLQSRKLPPEEALKIVPQLCDALEYAHSRGVIHRDIKPENILLAPGGVPKIADFGLAKMLKGEAAAPLTHTNIIMGTVEYMAPEQREKTKAVDHRADIFSMGVVLYEMLTGELPVGRFAPVSRKVAIDVRLDDVVLRALDADPNLRYQRASHLGTDVSAIAANARAGGGLEIREIGTDRVLGRVSGRRVVVRGPFKKVSLAGSGRPELLIDGNGQLKPGGEEAQIGANPGALLSLFVPRGVDVDIEGADGAISVEGLVGGLKAAAERGSVTVKRHDGPLEVHASKGGIEMESIRTARLTVRSGVGQVKIDDLLLEQGEGTVESVSGDISVRFDTAASARWQAHSADGDVKGPAGSAVMEHAGSGTVGAGQGRLTVTSSRGDVTISVGDLRHLMRSLGLQLPAWVSRNTFHTTLGLLALVIVIMVSGNGRAGLIVVAVSMAVVAHLGWKDWQAWTGKPPADPRRTLPPPVIPSVGTSGSPRLSAFAVASGAAGIVACLGFLLNIGIQIAVESGVSDAPYIALALGLAAVLCGLLALGIGAACVGHLREHAGALRGRAAGTFSLTAGGLAAGMALMLTLSYLHTMNDDAQAVRTFQSALASAVRDRSSKALDTWYPTDSVNLETRQAVRAVLDRLGERGVELAGGAWRYSDSRDRIAMTFEYAAPRREDRPAKEGMLYRVLLERRGRWWRLRGEKDVLHKLEEIDHELR